ncbi:MAG: N-acetylneuraminate synthase family protein [Thermincola sp.]|jgi:N-acetylneuraminate synthase|nr:N-acetylneuraminate synthase family protein [Thermincola sp.]MDT3703478.1 N-acetylneuraminate synthase family protein [Thermincola sp.]
MKINALKIGERLISDETPCFIIGEVAQSHDGSLGMAHAFIDAIADAGADAVKFQTHIASAESSPEEPWRVKFSYQDETRFDYWKRMEFSEDHWAGLKSHTEERGLIFLSSPFSVEAAELLHRIGVQAWKVASGEINNTMFFDFIKRTGLPVLLSTGMSNMDEIDKVVQDLSVGGIPYALLQCTSAYPCLPENVGLNVLEVFRRRYQCQVGLSDHSGTVFPGLAAVTLGATVLEVHVTLSKQMFGPDVPASITPGELRHLVEGTRFIEKMLENPVDKDYLYQELLPLRRIFTKSIAVRKGLSAGTVLTKEHLALKKPGTGIPSTELTNVIGKKINRNVAAGEILNYEDIEEIRQS